MSNRRNFTTLNNADAVRSDLLDCVAACRWRGLNTVAALDKIARHWAVAFRRVRTLVYRDQTILVAEAERAHLAARAAAFLDAVADEFREYEERCRAKAEAIRHREYQLQLPLGGDQGWVRGSGTESRRYAA